MMGMTVDDGIEAALQRVLRGPECFIGSGFPSHQEIARPQCFKGTLSIFSIILLPNTRSQIFAFAHIWHHAVCLFVFLNLDLLIWSATTSFSLFTLMSCYKFTKAASGSNPVKFGYWLRDSLCFVSHFHLLSSVQKITGNPPSLHRRLNCRELKKHNKLYCFDLI